MSVVEELISGLPRLPQILLGSGWDFILGPSDFKANAPTDWPCMRPPRHYLQEYGDELSDSKQTKLTWS